MTKDLVSATTFNVRIISLRFFFSVTADRISRPAARLSHSGAAFLRRQAFIDAGMMNVDLQCGLDYDLWIRLARHHALLKIDEYLATSRMHDGSKTLRERAAVFAASIAVLKTHYGYAPYSQIYGYCCARLDRRDGFFEPVSPSLLKYGAALLYGSLQNHRHLTRFWKEWLEQGSPRFSAKLRGWSSLLNPRQ